MAQIVQKNLGLLGKVRFDLVADGQKLARLTADSWAAWDFTVESSDGREIARIAQGKARGGLLASTKKDAYVVEILQKQEEPLQTLLVATALAIDTTLRQNHNWAG